MGLRNTKGKQERPVLNRPKRFVQLQSVSADRRRYRIRATREMERRVFGTAEFPVRPGRKGLLVEWVAMRSCSLLVGRAVLYDAAVISRSDCEAHASNAAARLCRTSRRGRPESGSNGHAGTCAAATPNFLHCGMCLVCVICSMFACSRPG